METLNIKMLKDNGRTVIYIEGADRERDEAAYAIVQSYMSGMLKSVAEPVVSKVPAESPKQDIKDEEEPVPNSPDDEPPEPENKPDVQDGIQEVEGLAPASSVKEEMPSAENLLKMEDYVIARRHGAKEVSTGKYAGKTPEDALKEDNELALVELFAVAQNMKSRNEEFHSIVNACKQYMAILPYESEKLYPTPERKIAFIKNISSIVPIKTFINGYADLDTFCTAAGYEEINAAFINIVSSLEQRGTQSA